MKCTPTPNPPATSTVERGINGPGQQLDVEDVNSRPQPDPPDSEAVPPDEAKMTKEAGEQYPDEKE